MNSRERILTTLAGEIPDRVGRFELFWPETLEAWRQQGLPADADILDHFGLDISLMPRPDLSFRFPIEVLEDAEDYTVHRDPNGVLRKDLRGKCGYTPHRLEYKLKTSADWWAFKEHLTADDDRVSPEAAARAKEARRKTRFAAFDSVEPYEAAWRVFGQVATSFSSRPTRSCAISSVVTASP